MSDPGGGSRWARAAGLFALTLLALALFEGALFRDELLFGRDLPRQFYPRCELIGQALAQGEIPRWNPWCNHGAPWFGPRAGGVLYPGHLLFAVLPLGRAMAWFIALHTALAIAGAWCLGREDARDVGVSDGGAWFTGLAFGLGGFVTSMHWALPYLVSSAWLPFGLLGARQLARGDRVGVAWLGAAVAMCLLAAEPQGALILGALAGTSALVHAPRGRRLVAGLVASLAILLGAAAGGLTLASVLDELPRLDRGSEGWKELRFALHGPGQLVDALVPGVHGHTAQHVAGFWGVSSWGGDMPWCGLGIGALGLVALLASGAGRTWRRPAWLEAAGWIVLGVALAAVDAGGPLGLRYPTKWLVITALGLARLVGLGAARLARGRSDWATPALLAFGLGLTLVGLVVALGGAPVDDLFSRVAPGYVLVPAAREVTAHALLRAGVAALVAAGASSLVARGRLSRGRARALLLGALALDLLTAARPGVLTIDRDDVPVHAQPALVEKLRARAGGPPGAPVRFEPKQVFWRQTYPPLKLAERELVERDAMRPNLSYRWQIRTMLAFESVEPVELSRLQRDGRWHAQPLLKRLALLDADLVLVDKRDAPNLGLPQEEVPILDVLDPYFDLIAVKNPLCPPWAYLMAASVSAPDMDGAFTALLDPGHGPDARVVLGPEGAPAQVQAQVEVGPTGAADVRVVRFSPERIELEVEAERAAWLVVREAFSPDWEATLDGEPVEVARADVMYRAVRVPEGRHAVAFSYAPAWWVLGLASTFVGWGALAVFALTGALGRRRVPPTAWAGASASRRG